MAFCQEHVSLRYFDMIQRNNFLVTQITICLVCFVSEFRVTTYIFPLNVLYYPFNLNGHLSFNQTFHGLPWNWPVKKAVLLTELWSDTKQSRYFMFKYLPFLPCLHIYQLLPTMWNKGGEGRGMKCQTLTDFCLWEPWRVRLFLKETSERCQFPSWKETPTLYHIYCVHFCL